MTEKPTDTEVIDLMIDAMAELEAAEEQLRRLRFRVENLSTRLFKTIPS